jgi:hypothetical protein
MSFTFFVQKNRLVEMLLLWCLVVAIHADFNSEFDTLSNAPTYNIGSLRFLQTARRTRSGPLYFKSGAAVDVDGVGPHYGDKYAQSETSLRLSGGSSLNADLTPYYVLPPQVRQQIGARIGDLGLIRYRGQIVAAVLGDIGPRAKIGELSRRAAIEVRFVRLVRSFCFEQLFFSSASPARPCLEAFRPTWSTSCTQGRAHPLLRQNKCPFLACCCE